MKDYILNCLTMKDILYKYGIKTNKNMFSCPFHGKDKKPSAKAYKNSFYCFTCTTTGDIIEFVEKYFNINFKEAMQKLNEDFNLGLNSNTKINYDKINEIKKQKEEKQKYKNKLTKEFIKLCDIRIFWENQIKNIDKYINLKNLDSMMNYKIEFEDKLRETELKIDYIEKKMATIE